MLGKLRARRDHARRLAALPPGARHLRPASGRRADAADQDPAGHRHRVADARAGRRRGAVFARLLPRHDAAEHPVPLRAAEGSSKTAMRELARRGSDHARGVRQLGAQHHRLPVRGNVATTRSSTSTPYAEAMTRYFLRHPLAGVLPRKFKIAFEGLHRGSRARVDQRHRLARADRQTASAASA